MINELTTDSIKTKIYIINGVEVMLDSDLAELYQVETKRINQAVTRNPNKFPEKYSWKLSDNDIDSLRSQIVTLEHIGKGQYSKYQHRVFTEQGVAMLATILKGDIATQMSKAIIDAFVYMRHYINYNKSILPNRFLLLEEKVESNAKKIDELFDKFCLPTRTRNCIFFKGELYDAYSAVMNILYSAIDEIIIIDNYPDVELLDMVRDIKIPVTIISNYIDSSLKDKFISQYNNVSFVQNNEFHDRFIIVDRIRLYHSGASFKDVGTKCFAINEIQETKFIDRILDIINL